MVTWAQKNHPQVDGRRETEKFINYWTAKSGRDATKLDWVLTWKNWIINAAERSPGIAVNGNGHHAPSPVSPRDEHRLRR
jgi:hypothetical protein